MRATFLGTSGAWPTPRPGCECDQCTEGRRVPRLRRWRSSLYLDLPGAVVLVDPGPDVWHQIDREALPPTVDRVLITHTHADHCLGLYDLIHVRADPKAPLPVGAAPFHRRRLAELFPHLLREGRERLVFEDWEAGTVLSFGDVSLTGFETGHREEFPTTGVLLEVPVGGRVRRIAYATDMGEMPPASRALLQGVDLFVGDGSFVGAGGYGHPGTDAVLALGRELGAERVAFTHIGHVLLNDADLRRRLGPGVGLAYDGGDLLALLDPA